MKKPLTFQFILCLPFMAVLGVILLIFLWPVLLIELYRYLANISDEKTPHNFTNSMDGAGICAVIMFWIYGGIAGYYYYNYHVLMM